MHPPTTVDAPELDVVEFNNLHYTTKAIGLALQRKRNSSKPGKVYYISFAGSNTACESLRASLHKRNAKLPASRWSKRQEMVAPSMKTVKRKLPGSAELHYIMWDATAPLILIRDDRALAIRQHVYKRDEPYFNVEDQLDDLKQEYRQQINVLFAQIVNSHTKTPILPEWAEPLMESTRSRIGWDAWEELEAHGDVVRAILVNPAFDWTQRVRAMLRDGTLTIPPLAPALEELAALGRARLLAAAQEEDHELEIHLVCNTPNALLFAPGRIVATTHFTDTVGDAFDYMHYLTRHLIGDWREQEMDAEDIEANQNAARASGDERQRVFSVFHYPDDGSVETPLTFWLITEWDRSVSTFLLPEDY
ncbi:MAG: hypothetical protein R6W76_21735 [Caldilinea sp.]